MFKIPLRFIIRLPILLYLILSAESEFQRNDRLVVGPESEVVVPIEDNALPCSELQVTSTGAECKTRFGLVARLDFPQVNLKSTLAGDEFLPKAKAIHSENEKKVGDTMKWVSITITNNAY
jgi:hypothetical protein